MPISYPDALSRIGWKILQVRPRTVLDIGCGCGLFGLLAREYTDIDKRRLHKEAWEARIDAIEVFPEYITSVHDWAYDRVFIGDALEVLPDLDPYDLVICTDVLEHFSFADGSRLLDIIRGKAAHAVISTPAKWIPQKGVFGNEYETHRHHWKGEELAAWGVVAQIGSTLVLEMKR